MERAPSSRFPIVVIEHTANAIVADSLLMKQQLLMIRFGEYRGPRKRVLESSWLMDTKRYVNSEYQGPDGEPDDSVGQDSASRRNGRVIA